MKIFMLSLLAVSLASAQSFNQSSITLIPNTNSSGAPVSAGTLLFRDLQVPSHTVTLESMDSVPQIIITSATAANPMVLTLASAPPVWVTAGATLNISGAAGAGCSTMNGNQTVTVASGTSVTIAYNGIGCTYTASSAAMLTYWIYKLWGPDVSGGGAVCSDGSQNLSINPACGSAGSGVPGAPVNSIQTNCSPNFCGSANFTRDPATGDVHSLGTTRSDFAVDVGAGPYGNIVDAFQIGLKNTGSATINVGPSLEFFADNSAGTKSYLGRVSGAWVNSTAGSEDGYLSFMVRASTGDTNALTEIMRIIDGSVIPVQDNMFLLGSPTNYWFQTYTDDLFAQEVFIGNPVTQWEFGLNNTACASPCLALRQAGLTNPFMTFYDPSSIGDARLYASLSPSATDTWTLGCATCGAGSTLLEWNDIFVKNLHCTGTGCAAPSPGITCSTFITDCMTTDTAQTVTGVKTWSASQLFGADNTYDVGTTTAAVRNSYSHFALTEDVLLGVPGTNFGTHWDIAVSGSAFSILDTAHANFMVATRFGANSTFFGFFGSLFPLDIVGNDGDLGSPITSPWRSLYLSQNATIGALSGGGTRCVETTNSGQLFALACPSGGGTVTSIGTSSPITGGTITTTGTIGCPSCITTAGGQTIGGSLTAGTFISNSGTFVTAFATASGFTVTGGGQVQATTFGIGGFANSINSSNQFIGSGGVNVGSASITGGAHVATIYDVAGGFFGQDRTGGVPILTATGTCTMFFKGGILYAFSGGGC